MDKIPDLNRIGSVVSSWQRGVVTAEEAQQWIHAAMDPVNYIPAEEMVPLPEANESVWGMGSSLARVEQKLNLVIHHLGVPLPSFLDPKILSPEVIELAEKNEKINAVALHRQNTGARLAATCDLINKYLQERRGFH